MFPTQSNQKRRQIAHGSISWIKMGVMIVVHIVEFSCLPSEMQSDGDSRWTGNARLPFEISAGQIFT